MTAETYVLAFESTHAAMAASKALADAGVAFYTIPTPRAISAGCGMALKFDAQDPGAVAACALSNVPDCSLAALYRMVSPTDCRKLPQP